MEQGRFFATIFSLTKSVSNPITVHINTSKGRELFLQNLSKFNYGHFQAIIKNKESCVLYSCLILLRGLLFTNVLCQKQGVGKFFKRFVDIG